MSADADVCAVCGERANPQNPLVDDEYYRGLGIHLHCLNSPEGHAYHESRCAADPGYARYSMLITAGQRVVCSSCGAEGRLSPKAYGMGAGQWEANCTRCHDHSAVLSAYRSPAEAQLIQRLQHLWQRFKLGVDEAGIPGEIERLDLPAESGRGCACGGTYSISAPPRCARCSNVLLASPFHIMITDD